MSTIETTNRPRIFVSLIMSMLLVFSVVTPQSVHTDIIIVDTLFDGNDGSYSDVDCSLREAIQVAAPGDTITFSVTGTIILTLGQIIVDKDLTINGPGPDNLTVSGNNNSRVFFITGGNPAFSGLTISDGYTNDYGGGMYNNGTSTLTNVTFSGNSADYGGGMYNIGAAILTNVNFSGNSALFGGGMSNDGTATLTNVIFSGNTAGIGGGMSNEGTTTLTNVIIKDNTAGEFRAGGGMFNDGTATLKDVTISRNSARIGGGMLNMSTTTLTNVTFSDNAASWHGGGMSNDHGTSTLTNVTFSGNSADYGGGMENYGTSILTKVTFNGNSSYYAGGMYNGGCCISKLTNVTFSGNSAYIGGGMANGMPCINTTIILTNVTFNSNSASSSGGGVYVSDDIQLYLKSTILAGNTAPSGPDCSGTITSLGYNLIPDSNSCSIVGDEIGNIYGEDPLLGPLADNGGYSLTHALLPGSPAIDAADDTDVYGNPVSQDQRGVFRPQGPANDIGAFEFGYPVYWLWLPFVLK